MENLKELDPGVREPAPEEKALATLRSGRERMRLAAEVNDLEADLARAREREDRAKADLDKVLHRAKSEDGAARALRTEIQGRYETARAKLLATFPELLGDGRS